MADVLDLGSDEGYVEVAVTIDGERVAKRFDLLDLWRQLREIRAANKEVDGWLVALHHFVRDDLGFAGCSVALARRLATGIADRVAEVTRQQAATPQANDGAAAESAG